MTAVDHLAELDVFSPIEGWDCVGKYAFVEGRFDRGRRTEPEERWETQAWQMRACVQYAVSDWPAITFATTVPQNVDDDRYQWRWAKLHPIDEKFGVAPELLAVVNDLHPGGEWRVGGYPGLRMGHAGKIVAKVNEDGRVVGLIAPCHRIEADDAA